MSTTLDGPQKFLDIVRDIAGQADVLNAMMGVGLVVKTGVIMTDPPDVTVSIDGMSSMGGQFILSEAEGDLLVPEDLRVTSGDTVALIPLSKRQWAVLFKTRNSLTASHITRYGVNRDRLEGGDFAGVEVTVDPDTGASSVWIQADSILFTGDLVITGNVSITGTLTINGHTPMLNP
jgi:hypothetical protein